MAKKLLKRRKRAKKAAPVVIGDDVIRSLQSLPLPYAEEMTIEALFDIEDCPRQRDTAKRAARAKHLDVLFPTHTVVFIAEFLDGRRIKLDCHTRIYKWASGTVPMPERILGIILPVETMEQVFAYYTHFDNAAATETAADKVCGAVKQHAIKVASPFLGDGRIGTPVRYMSRALRVEGVQGIPDSKHPEFMYTMIGHLAEQLVALDSIDPKASKFRGPLATAFMLAHRKLGDEVIPFFKAVNDNAGSEENGKFCPLQGVKRVFDSINGGGQTEHMLRVGKVLRLMENWLGGAQEPCYRSLPRQIDAYGYLEDNDAADKE